MDRSFRLFDVMKKRGIQPDDTTLESKFATCAIRQQFEMGLHFLDHLTTSDGYKPTLKVLKGAMQLCNGVTRRLVVDDRCGAQNG